MSDRRMRNRESRRGTTIAEFAFTMAFLLVPMLAGVWDVSTFIDINHVLTRAAREGVVIASRGDDPTQSIVDYAESAGLYREYLSVDVNHGEEIPGLGQEVEVSLNYEFGGYTIFPWADFLPGGISSRAFAKME